MKWWWVILLAIFCFGLYEQGARILEKEMNQLQEEIDQINRSIDEALLLKEDLKLQINSQSDPAWIEQVLIRCLGLVPENATKVYFSQSEEE